MPEDKGIWTGTYEREFALQLSAAIQSGSVTYDIGSWHGFFAGVMAAQGASQVHVFEPLPENAERVQNLINLNPDKDIRLHTCAVADIDTTMDLIQMPETSMAKLEVSPLQSGERSEKTVRVAVRSIDSVIAAGEAPPPRLMKIDVEGSEFLVLRGAIRTIRDHRPELFIEVHSSALLHACEAVLGAEGYTIEHLGTGHALGVATGVCQIRAFPVKK